MTTFRQWKELFGRELLPPSWPLGAGTVPASLAAIDSADAVSALFAFLPRGGLYKWRSVILLGRIVAAVAARRMEDGRVIMRRCMWHMNEDSGNMGWGVAEAMGEVAAASAPLAAEFGKIVLSYANDTGKADNYIDFAPLRRGVYWAVGRVGEASPSLRGEAFTLLCGGLGDNDAEARGMAAWALGKLAVMRAGNEAARDEAARLLAGLFTENAPCELLDGLMVRNEPAGAFAREAHAALAER